MALDLPEKNESLWQTVAAPTIWALHFLSSYGTAAVWCAKVGGPLGAARWLIGLYTLVALLGICWVGWRGRKRWRPESAPGPHDRDSPGSRHRFLGFATTLLAGLSAVAVS